MEQTQSLSKSNAQFTNFDGNQSAISSIIFEPTTSNIDSSITSSTQGHSIFWQNQIDFPRNITPSISLRTTNNCQYENHGIKPNTDSIVAQAHQYILVIDDEPSVREVTAEILREASVHTLEAANGPIGIELFRQHREAIVLVLLDFFMPGMDGKQVLEEIWEIDSTVPILIFSGYGKHHVMRQFKQQSMIGFLQKPYTIHQLLQAVQQSMKHH